MARIAGVDLPKNKNIEIALTYIHGIGRSSSKNILKQLEIDPKRKSGQLDDQEVARIREVIDNTCKVEGDLRRELSMNIKRLMDLGTYRGLRHRKSLPLRGQRTSTNARTRKGPRRRMVGRKSKAS
ncbi:MAG: 30S ribosomal protein S13 [Deltaproteobacteria bacterium]|nr:30S ribosomal protein S13 [Deltaproteobacteria bacterium]MBW2651977.1 30S ribosomal protein S13 [Deltaproteobacteria bacterium]MCK5187647.1 30S ribosomal protein S13 [Deltaproteobacteria bacterium]MCK5421893.1 30S ribosomal protein S13 [Deltaproteobacteria bacterium]MCK5514183.1 30S ribosomal protein S13 [Deltaproteobacteria bacterium]